MRSRILHGNVWHMRTRPRYFFRYGAFYLDLDLDELEDVDRRLRLFSRNRLNLLSLRERDYLVLANHISTMDAHSPGPSPMRGEGPGVGIDLSNVQPPTSFSLITHPRVLNYAFNPVSFLLARDGAGAIGHVTAEVHNTWGERHLYDLAPWGPKGYRSGAEKRFYVSPFIDMEGRYEFRLDERANRVRIRLDEYRTPADQAFFRAGMDLRPLPLTDANILHMVARYPLVTLKTIAAIHWQGLKLWLRGERFRPNPSRSKRPLEVPP